MSKSKRSMQTGLESRVAAITTTCRASRNRKRLQEKLSRNPEVAGVIEKARLRHLVLRGIR